MARQLNRKQISLIGNGCGLVELELQAPPIGLAIGEASLARHLARHGGWRLLLEMAEKWPSHAASIFGESVPGGLSNLELAGRWMDPASFKRALSTSEMEMPQFNPLLGSLSLGRWTEAAEWLSLEPQWAVSSAFGFGALHFCAAPIGLPGCPPPIQWEQPPSSLIEALIEKGAPLSQKGSKGRNALAMAMDRGSGAAAAAMASICEESVDELDAKGFSLVHMAAWSGSHEALAAMAARGADLNALTSKGFDAFDLAMHHGWTEAAKCLIDNGFDPKGASVRSKPCSAARSKNPESWLAACASAGFDMSRRDSQQAHWAELLFEFQDPKLATAAWAGFGEEPPKRSPASLLGVLERAARSRRGAGEKMLWLFEMGHFPARLRCEEPKPSRIDLGMKCLELSEMWDTVPDRAELLDERTPSGSLAVEVANRPSLLPYCVAHGGSGALEAAIAWDGQKRFFSKADYLCAWSQAIRSNAPAAAFEALEAASSQRGFGSLSLAAPAALRAAAQGFSGKVKLNRWISKGYASLGPSKWEASGLGQLDLKAHFFEIAKAEAADNRLADLLLVGRKASSMNWMGILDRRSPAAAFERIAAGGAFHAILSARLAIDWASRPARPKKAAKGPLPKLPAKLRGLAALCPSESPWGKDPGAAVKNWDAQIRHESAELVLELSRQGFLATPMQPSSSPSEFVLTALIEAGCFEDALLLVESGLEPASGAELVLASMGHSSAASAGSSAAARAARDGIRRLAQALGRQTAWREALSRAPSGAISNLLGASADPGVWEAFALAGADLGSGGSNAALKACKLQKRGLSPAMAGRLSAINANLHPANPGSAFHALLESARSSDPSASKSNQLARAALAIGEEGWALEAQSGLSPLRACLEKGYADCAIEIRAALPSGWNPGLRFDWPLCWAAGAVSKAGVATRLQDAKSLEKLASQLEEVKKWPSESKPAFRSQSLMAFVSALSEMPQMSALHAALWIAGQGVDIGDAFGVHQNRFPSLFRALCKAMGVKEPDEAPQANVLFAALHFFKGNPELPRFCHLWLTKGWGATASCSGKSIRFEAFLDSKALSEYEKISLSFEPAPWQDDRSALPKSRPRL